MRFLHDSNDELERLIREPAGELRDNEARLAAELAETKLLQGISAALVQHDRVEDLYGKIMDAAVTLMRSDYASMQMLYPERGSRGELHLLAFRGFTPEAAKFWEWVRADSESTCGIALRTGRRVIMPDVEKCDFMPSSEDRAMYLKTGIRAVQSTPLLSRTGRLVGMLSTHWRAPHHPSERDLRLLDILAPQAAYLIERKQAEEALQKTHIDLVRQLHFTEALLKSIPTPVFFKDAEGRYLGCNKAFTDLMGVTPEEIAGKTVFELWPSEQAYVYHQQDMKLLENPAHQSYEFTVTTRKGEVLDVIFEKGVFFDERGRARGIVGAFLDITKLKRNERIIKHQAHHDALTGLPNRFLFKERFSYELARAQRYCQKMAVMFLDLDRFKVINDTLGHAVGDELLKKVSSRLKHCLRQEDTIARLGGDEFGILLPCITQAGDAAKIARKIIPSLQQSFLIDGQEIRTSASIGISLYPEDGEYEDTLLRNADIAMYHAKEQGRNNFQFYDSRMNIRTLERMILENRLRQTLERGELVVYYQPQIDIRTHHLVSCEALVRWKHPERGLLNPQEFIPLAEEIGFIISLDEWVLRTACSQSKAWQEEGHPPVCITVNFSGRLFKHPDIVETVTTVLKETGLPAELLELEVSEHTAMEDIEATLPKLHKLAHIGVKFSIDDFGTGYSSLNHLKRLPLHKLKIDQSFVRGIGTSPEDRAIISAVVAMAHKMGLKVIAEGVENDEQLNYLHACNCDEMQGYLFSEPVPAGDFEKLMVLHRKGRLF